MKVVGYLADNGKTYKRKSDRTKSNIKTLKQQFEFLAKAKGYRFGKI